MPTQQLQTQQQPGATVGSVRGVVSLVMPSDLTEGNYSCVGSNALGEVSQEITVIVRSKLPSLYMCMYVTCMSHVCHM